MRNKQFETDRLVLGTFQLGVDYGIANKLGKPDFRGALDIVSAAWEGGIRQFDTAQIYGNSESVLGEVLSSLGVSHEAKVITKLHPDMNHLDKTKVVESVERSIKELKITRLHCLMVHNEDCLDLLNEGLIEILNELKEDGLIENLGVSVYAPYRALQALNSSLFNMVQVPSNILDQRFEKEGVFDIGYKLQKKVHVRSIFLQGLILMGSENLPERLLYAKSEIIKLETIAKELNMQPKELAMGYMKIAYPDSYILFGAEESRQVKENLSMWKRNISPKIVTEIRDTFQDVDINILNVRLWPKR